MPASVVEPDMHSLDESLRHWGRWMRAADRSPDTIDLRHWHVRHVLRSIGATADPWSVTVDDLVTWLADQDWESSTRRSYYASLRGFYGWARDRGIITSSPAHALPSVKLVRKRATPIPEDDYERAYVSAPSTRIVIALLLAGDCGLRRFEIAKARREDVRRDLLGWHIHVIGKGRKERDVPLPDDLAHLILAQPAGWLFPSPAPGCEGRPITPGCMGKWIRKGLPREFTTHSLRHRAATVALEETMDHRAVQEMLGHESLATTELYTHVNDRRVRAAIAAVATRRRKIAYRRDDAA